MLNDPTHQVPNPHNIVDADWQNSIWDVMFNFWSDQTMTVDDAIAQMKDNYDSHPRLTPSRRPGDSPGRRLPTAGVRPWTRACSTKTR